MTLLRPAREADAAALARLCGILGYPSGESVVAGRLARVAGDAAHSLVVAAPAGSVVGFVHAHAVTTLHCGDAVDIAALVVDASARGQGVGDALVGHVCDWAAERGVEWVVVGTRPERAPARALYERHGFELWKRHNVLRRAVG